jgi:DNA-directed RNA polymerase
MAVCRLMPRGNEMSGDEPNLLSHSEDLSEREAWLEKNTLEISREVWTDRHMKRAWSAADWHLLLEAIPRVTEAIRDEQNRLRNRGRRVPAYASALRSFDAEKLALITLRSILNAILTRGVDDGEAPSEAEITKDICRWCRRVQSFRHRKTPGGAGLDNRDWSRDRQGLQLGLFLLRLALDHALTEHDVKLFERAKTFETGRNKVKAGKEVVRLSAAAQQSLKSNKIERIIMAPPPYLPMLARPDHWTKSERGGYFYIKDIDLVKRSGNSRIQKALDSADLLLVFQAVNALHDPPWKINRGIYEVVHEALDRRLDLPGLPADSAIRGSVNLSPRANSSGTKWHSAQIRLVQAEIAKCQGQLLLVRDRMDVCKAFLDEPFYFPYSLDHRGRAYPIPSTYLN